jgi:hypothetical protein
MASCEQLALWLAEAEDAQHALQMGGKVESLRLGEKQIDYTKGNGDQLAKYIAWLRQQVDACNGRTFRRGVLGIIPVDSNN